MLCKKSGASHLNCRLRKSVVTDACERTDNGYTGVCLFSRLHLLHRVALNYVTDLMAESSCELVQLVCALDESAIDVDISTGQGKGVNLLCVHDVEMPIQVRAAGGLCNGAAKILDIATDCRIGDDRQLRVDLLGVPPAERDLLVLRNRAGQKRENDSQRDDGTVHPVTGIRVNSARQDMFHSSPLHRTEGQA
ncbi:MAG: hypothetical protein QOH22_1417 [Gemmatimonadaceae bacterium]|nr:hypothetical protein [Gemmatimonadaceae bacterium]